MALGGLSQISWGEVNPDIEGDWDKLYQEGPWPKIYHRINDAQRSLLREMARRSLSLNELNDRGVYHRLDRKYAVRIWSECDSRKAPKLEPSFFWKCLKCCKKEKKPKEKWIANGRYPGIWCGVLHPGNAAAGPLNPVIIRFTFKADYKIYDPLNEEHIKLWNVWSSVTENFFGKENPWDEMISPYGESMTFKMQLQRLPHHKCFFEENRFGAVVMEHDYVALVILLEDSLEEVKGLLEKHKHYKF